MPPAYLHLAVSTIQLCILLRVCACVWGLEFSEFVGILGKRGSMLAEFVDPAGTAHTFTDPCQARNRVCWAQTECSLGGARRSGIENNTAASIVHATSLHMFFKDFAACRGQLFFG